MNVTRGNPTPEELAAVVAVLTARAAAAGAAARAAADQDQTSVWADRGRNIHRVPQPGPSSWRASTWPVWSA